MLATEPLNVYYNGLPAATLVSRSVGEYTNVTEVTIVFTVNQAVTWRYKFVNQYDASKPAYQIGSSTLVDPGSDHSLSLSNVGEGTNQLYVEVCSCARVGKGNLALHTP